MVLFTLQTFAQLNGTKKDVFFILSEFKVKDVRTNGIDYTKKALEGENNLFFYKDNETNEVLFSNYWKKTASQSYGPIYNLEFKYFKETYENYEREEYKFKWSYKNTYEEKVGTCDADLFLEYKPMGIYFDLKLIAENLDELHYRGEFNGTMSYIKHLLNK